MTDNELNGVLAERELDVLLALEQCVALGIFASSETTAAAAAIIRRLVDQRDEARAARHDAWVERAVEIVEGVMARWDGAGPGGAYDAGWNAACRECLKELNKERE